MLTWDNYPASATTPMMMAASNHAVGFCITSTLDCRFLAEGIEKIWRPSPPRNERIQAVILVNQYCHIGRPRESIYGFGGLEILLQ